MVSNGCSISKPKQLLLGHCPKCSEPLFTQTDLKVGRYACICLTCAKVLMADYGKKTLETPTFTELVELSDQAWGHLLQAERHVNAMKMIKELNDESSSQ